MSKGQNVGNIDKKNWKNFVTNLRDTTGGGSDIDVDCIMDSAEFAKLHLAADVRKTLPKYYIKIRFKLKDKNTVKEKIIIISSYKEWNDFLVFCNFGINNRQPFDPKIKTEGEEK